MRLPNPSEPANNGAGAGGPPSLWRLDVPRDVQILKWAVPALAGVVGLMFWFFLGRIDARFDQLNEPLRTMTASAAEQAATAKATAEKLDKLDGRVDHISDRLDAGRRR